MLFYPAALPLSRQTLTYAAGLIRRHRAQIGTPWRKLTCGQQALLVLAYLRNGETFAELAAGFGVGTATAWRYVTETVGLLAARSPTLHTALRGANQEGHAYVVIDGTLIPIDRVAADRPFYSGKHHRHGMNLQVIASPDGDILWVSGPLPGATHDLTAARIWGILRERSINFCKLRTLLRSLPSTPRRCAAAAAVRPPQPDANPQRPSQRARPQVRSPRRVRPRPSPRLPQSFVAQAPSSMGAAPTAE
jgi:hypothetical protein